MLDENASFLSYRRESAYFLEGEPTCFLEGKAIFF
jgi:hypothetical protein